MQSWSKWKRDLRKSRAKYIDVQIEKQKKQRQTIGINSVESKNKIGKEARDSKEPDENKGGETD